MPESTKISGPKRLDDRTRETLTGFLRDIRQLPASLPWRRAAVRNHVKEILEEIDAIVRTFR